MENLSLLTYTHSKTKALHKAYFGRIKKYFPNLKYNYVTCDEDIEYAKCIIYDNNTPHYQQMINALNQIDTEYVIYSQEDYILFDYVKIENIERYLKIMDDDFDIGFIRLIQSGVGNNFELYNDELMVLDPNLEYYFSTQITIWRKDVLIKMFECSKINSIFDEPKNSVYLKHLFTTGLYTINKGNKVGGHYNSYDYPYIATAKVKGKWNIEEYPNEINELIKEYDIRS